MSRNEHNNDAGPLRFYDVTPDDYEDYPECCRPMVRIDFIEYLTDATQYLFDSYPEVERVVARPRDDYTIVLVGLTDPDDAVINGHLWVGMDARL